MFLWDGMITKVLSMLEYSSLDFESKFKEIKEELVEVYPNLKLTYEKTNINKCVSKEFSLNFLSK